VMLKSPLRAYRASGIGNCADAIELAVAIACSPSHQLPQLPECGNHGQFLLLADCVAKVFLYH
jgi:hypothetical protein